MNSKRIILALLFTIIFSHFSVKVKAQPEGNDIFKSLVLWSLRYGTDNQEFVKTTTNLLTNEIEGTETLDYKSRRLTIDGIHAEFSGGTDEDNFVRFGMRLGINTGLSIQRKDRNPIRKGALVAEGYPSGFAGNQGDLASSSYALSFEMLAGGAIAFNIIPDDNLQVSAGYSLRFWSKGNMGFYALPKFYGGFWDVNATYGSFALNTTFRVKEYHIDDFWGTVNTNYVSLMPMYIFEGDGLSTVLGPRFEFWQANANNSNNSTPSRRWDSSLNANSMLVGVYFGFTY